MSAPQFGDWYLNKLVGVDNPTRLARFVRVEDRPRGFTNPGLWWEMTDGNGEFWLSRPANLELVPPWVAES